MRDAERARTRPKMLRALVLSGIAKSGGQTARPAVVGAALPSWTQARTYATGTGADANRSRGLATGSAAAKVEGEGKALEILRSVVGEHLQEMRDSGTFKRERVITSPQEMVVSILEEERKEEVVNMCANNYLGLSNHPAFVEAAKKALGSHGFGLSSVRFICGTQDIHLELEKKISDFHGTQDTILYPSCFDADAGLFEVLLTKEDAVLSDELNHASIIDGIRLCKAQRHRYKHLDLVDLESKLIETQTARQRLIATDGVFSMDGHIAPLHDIVALAKKYNALVFVDECHATGFLGKTGRGTEEFCGLAPGTVDIVNSTLGKALGGGTGGYTTGRQEIVDLLRQKARPYLFSNTLAPAMVAACTKVFDLISHDTTLRDNLESNSVYFRTQMREAGFAINDGDHPIVPIMLGDAKVAHDMAEQMLERGVYVVGFSYPVVPKDKARIRVQISGAHTKDQLDKAIQEFVNVGKGLGIL